MLKVELLKVEYTIDLVTVSGNENGSDHKYYPGDESQNIVGIQIDTTVIKELSKEDIIERFSYHSISTGKLITVDDVTEYLDDMGLYDYIKHVKYDDTQLHEDDLVTGSFEVIRVGDKYIYD